MVVSSAENPCRHRYVVGNGSRLPRPDPLLEHSRLLFGSCPHFGNHWSRVIQYNTLKSVPSLYSTHNLQLLFVCDSLSALFKLGFEATYNFKIFDVKRRRL